MLEVVHLSVAYIHTNTRYICAFFVHAGMRQDLQKVFELGQFSFTMCVTRLSGSWHGLWFNHVDEKPNNTRIAFDCYTLTVWWQKPTIEVYRWCYLQRGCLHRAHNVFHFLTCVHDYIIYILTPIKLFINLPFPRTLYERAVLASIPLYAHSLVSQHQLT